MKHRLASITLLFWALNVHMGKLKAAQVVFSIDPTQSQITLSGTVAAFDGELTGTITEQTSGSLTAAYGGSINADVSGNTIAFTGSSLISAQNNSSPLQPAPGGSPGSGPADYGGMAQKTIFFDTVGVEIALREVTLDLTSPELPLTNGTFSASSLEFSFSTNASGTIDYDSPSLGESGTDSLTGSSTDASSTPATLTAKGNVQVLTIPVNMTFTDTSGTLDGTTLVMVGQFVATLTNLPPPVISSISVSDQAVTLTVSNATAQSQVLTSADLNIWSTQTADVTNLLGQIVFTFPTSGGVQFFRVKQ